MDAAFLGSLVAENGVLPGLELQDLRGLRETMRILLPQLPGFLSFSVSLSASTSSQSVSCAVSHFPGSFSLSIDKLRSHGFNRIILSL